MVNINVELLAPLHTSQVEPFKALLTELVQVVPIPAEVSDLEIRVVPPRSTGEEANRLLGRQVYHAAAPAHGALIIPTAHHDSLHCAVIIGVDEFDGLSSTVRPDGLVSSLLEEILHAHAYGLRWRHGGNFLRANVQPEAGPEIVASRVHDEYVVCRAKNELAAALPLFDAPGLPGYRTQRIFTYGGNLTAIILGAERQLAEIRQAHANGQIDLPCPDENVALNLVFRQILDPLARTHGFIDGLPKGDRARFPPSLPGSEFYLSDIAPHWRRMHSSLRESYDSQLTLAPSIISVVMAEVEQLTQRLEEHLGFPTV